LGFTTGQCYLKKRRLALASIVHVEDIASAILPSRSDRDRIHNQAFNVGLTTENYQIREIAELVRTYCRQQDRICARRRPDLRSYRVDCNYNWPAPPRVKPQWTARRGVEQLYDAYCRTGVTLDDLKASAQGVSPTSRKLIATERSMTSFAVFQLSPVPFDLNVASKMANSVREVACRSCGSARLETFLDLGETPLADRLLTEADLGKRELTFLPGCLLPRCSLVQITETANPEFSSPTPIPILVLLSRAAQAFARDVLELMRGASLDRQLHLELASNDGIC